MFFFDLCLNKRLIKHEAGDLRRYRDQYDVTVMHEDGSLAHYVATNLCYKIERLLWALSVSKQCKL